MARPPPKTALGRIPLGLPTLLIGAGALLGLTSSHAHALLATPLLLLGAGLPRLRLGAWCVLLGLLLGRSAQVASTPPPPLAGLELPAVHVLRGRVRQVDLPAYGAQRFTLRLVRIGDPGRRLTRPFDLPVTVRLQGQGGWRWHDLVPGSHLEVLARLQMRRDGLRAVATARSCVTLLERGEGPAAALARARRRATWPLARALPRRDAGLARALLLGDRGRLAREDRALFRGTGQAHLLAVSGLHVGLLVGGFVLLLRLAGAGLRTTWIAGLLLAVLYVPFTGAPPSALRAGLGATAWFLGALLARPPRGLAVLTLVALLVVLAGPGNVHRVAFQLSFAAVTSILLLAPRLRGLLLGETLVIQRLLAPKRAPVRTAFAVSLAAWLGTAPLVALHIGRLCPAASLLAVPAVPLTAVLLGSGFVLLLAADVPPLASAAAWSFTHVAELLRAGLALAHAGHLGARPTHAPTLAWGALYVLAFGHAARGSARALRFGLLAMLALLAALLLPTAVPGFTMERGRTERAPYDAVEMPLLADIPPETASSQPPVVLFAAVGLLGFAALAVRLRWLQVGGAVAAWILGAAATYAFGLAGLAALLAPFLVATVLGKLPGAPRAGARSLRQVTCNGVPAFVGIALALGGFGDVGFAWFLGALACLGADTCATEIGVRYGGTPFRLIGRGPLAAGDSGGVTFAGLLASAGGAMLAPAAALALQPASAVVFGLLTAAGVAAGLLDSLLGASLQFLGRDTTTGEVTERPPAQRADVERLRGIPWLDNDAVNLVTGFAGGLLAVAWLSLA